MSLPPSPVGQQPTVKKTTSKKRPTLTAAAHTCLENFLNRFMSLQYSHIILQTSCRTPVFKLCYVAPRNAASVCRGDLWHRRGKEITINICTNVLLFFFAFNFSFALLSYYSICRLGRDWYIYDTYIINI